MRLDGIHRLAVGLALLALAGCSGSRTVLPGFDNAALSAAQSEIAATRADVEDRSVEQNRQMVADAWQRLQPSVLEMCRHFNTSPCRFTVSFREDDVVNAFADGQRMVMFNGLVKYLGSEDEVALVLGHEAAHNILDHVEQSQLNTAMGTLAGVVIGVAAGVLTGDSQVTEAAVGVGAGVGGSVGRLSYSKEHEREADYVGAYLLDHANYDLAQARNLYAELGQLSKRSTTSMFDTHPASPDRLAAFDAARREIDNGSRWPIPR